MRHSAWQRYDQTVHFTGPGHLNMAPYYEQILQLDREPMRPHGAESAFAPEPHTATHFDE
jgi:hypothetical protein